MEFLVTLTTFDTQGTAVEVDREGTRVICSGCGTRRSAARGACRLFTGGGPLAPEVKLA